MEKLQEYYLNGDVVTIVHKFKIKDYSHVVYDNGGEWNVTREDRLQKYEDTYLFKQREGIKAETERLRKEQQVEVDKIINKAVGELTTRMKLNSVFGSFDSNVSAIGLQMAKELEKLMRNK